MEITHQEYLAAKRTIEKYEEQLVERRRRHGKQFQLLEEVVYVSEEHGELSCVIQKITTFEALVQFEGSPYFVNVDILEIKKK